MSKFWSTATAASDSDASSSSSSEEHDDDSSVDWDDDNEESEDGNNDVKNIGFEDGILGIDAFHSKPEESFSAKAALETTKDPENDPNIIWAKIKNDQAFLEVPTADGSEPKSDSSTRIVLMSDTHNRHRDIPFLPKGDILIHGGDFTKSGEIGTVKDLSDYFAEHGPAFEEIFCIAGNHELTFQPKFYKTAKRRHNPKAFDPYETRAALKNCTYLEDASTTTVHDIEVYGSPWTPAFYDWAFNLPRGEALDRTWAQIPSSTDVLITHGPPLGRGDFTDHSGRAGCHELLQHVQRIRPRLHVFGHVHSGYGYSFDGQTLFVNASNLDSDTEIASKPCIVVDLPHDQSQPARTVTPSCAIETMGEFLRWLEKHRYNKILSCAPRDDLSRRVPFPHAFSNESAFFDLCGILNLFRDPSAREELRKAVCQLYSESFS